MYNDKIFQNNYVWEVSKHDGVYSRKKVEMITNLRKENLNIYLVFSILNKSIPIYLKFIVSHEFTRMRCKR